MLFDRTGKVGTLTLRKQDPLGQVEEEKKTGESPGTFTVLELDQDSSRFYVGGVPSTANVSPSFIFLTCTSGCFPQSFFIVKKNGTSVCVIKFKNEFNIKLCFTS